MRLFAAMFALVVGSSAFAGEKTIWSSNIYVNTANVWTSTGWLPAADGGVTTNTIVIRSSGAYCDLRVADPIYYTSVRSGRVFPAYFNTVTGGYSINEGRVTEVNFNLIQNLYANVHCMLAVGAIVDDNHSGGFSYQDADHASNMLALSALNMNLTMKSHAPDYDNVKVLIEDLEAAAQSLRDQIKARQDLPRLEREFIKVQDAYSAFTYEFVPLHADVKSLYLDLRNDYRVLRGMFDITPVPAPVPPM